jgi:hypothetical protein
MKVIINFLRYLFHPIPGSPFQFYTPLLIFAASLIIAGIIAHYWIKKNGQDNRAIKRLFGGLPRASYWCAALLLANLFGRYERFPLLGARFVLYGILLLAFFVYGKTIYRYIKIYPQEQERFRETPAQKKYTIEKYARR